MPQLETTTRTVALIGNPNTGKSTLFSALVGIHQHVGNYPGVTVEKKTGRMEHAGRPYELIDLPGLYSLAPRFRDEMVAVDLLLGRRRDAPPVDVVLCIVDASNLERNLYLVSQVLELGLPTVLAVNMIDVAEDHGITVDLEGLRRQLAIPIVPIQANRRIGLAELQTALDECRPVAVLPAIFPEAFEREATDLEEYTGLPRYLVRRLVLDTGGYLNRILLRGGDRELATRLTAARRRLAEAGCAVPAIEATARYDWARRVLEGVVVATRRYHPTASDRLDRVLTHRVWGLAVFALVMVVVFQGVFAGAEPLKNLIDGAFRMLGHAIEIRMAEGALRSLLVDGVIAGVGGVLAFLPQILILFFFIAVLEDCGYMARAAYLMDKFMVRAGLSGKSFIPMLSSFACAVPGIMAARVIEDERDRLTTILVAPLLTCSARLPVYTLLIAAFIPAESYVHGLVQLQGMTLVGLYVLGIVMAVLVARVLKRTLLRGQPPPFVMELPSYKWPSPRTIVYRVVERGGVFLRCAGTLILAVSIIIWAALYYPHNAASVAPLRHERDQWLAKLERLPAGDPQQTATAAAVARLTRQIEGEYQRHSFLGRAGRLIEPVVKPLGWDWRIGCAVIASFPAREVVVATMGVIFNLGDDADAQTRLRAATWNDTSRPVFTLPVALSIMVFFALCAQCAATLAVIRRETNSWRWPAFTFAYMTVLAYVGAFVTYQAATWIHG